MTSAVRLPAGPFWRRWAPLGATLLAFALRAGFLNAQSLWRDEVDALRFATQGLEPLLAMFRSPAQNGPLYFLGLRPWLALTGHSEVALRLPSALAGALAVAVTYALIRRLLGARAAGLAALLMAVAPYLVWYGQEAKMYALLTVLVPGSLLATLAAARRGARGRWIILYLLTSAAFYTHLLAALVVPVQAAWLLILLRGRLARRSGTVALYLGALCLPYLPLLAWQPAYLLAASQTGFDFVPLSEIVQVLAVGFSLGVEGAAQPWLLLPAMFLLLAGSVLPFVHAAERDAAPAERRGVALLLVWLAVPPALLYLITLRIPLFTDRYLIWMAPAFMALLAAGVTAFRRVWRPAGILALLLLLAAQGQALVRQATVPIKSDFRAVAAYVTPRMAPGDVLVYQIPYIRYTFSYYASGSRDPESAAWRGIDGPYTNDGSAEADVATWLEGQTADARGVWLIASETSLWDSRDLTRNWLAQQGNITDARSFARVDVVHYDLAAQ